MIAAVRASVAALLGTALVAGCDPGPAERVRASDAGFVYAAREETGRAASDAGVLPALDALDASRPSLTLVVGAPGGRGDLDGIGGEARLGLVGGMVRVGDAIVFADEGNGTIRRFVPETSAVETIAHLPSPGGHRPSLPAYLAYDGKHLYITDRGNHVLYALDLETRALTIVAGKPGTRGDTDGVGSQALFDSPTGLAFDGDHTLYLADVGGRHIRRVDLATSSVSTVPGSFLQVWGLCFDDGALYATDNLSESVFHVDPRTGEQQLVAGSNRFGYAGPTDGLPKAARFREPRGIACGHDALYVADRGNSAVRRLDKKTHVVKTLAGRSGLIGFRDGYGEQALFSEVQSVLEWDDRLYIGDEATLRELSVGRSVVRTAAGAPSELTRDRPDRSPLVKPEAVVVVPEDHAAFVASCGNFSVQRVDLDTRAITLYAGDPLFPGFVDGSGGDARFTCASAIAYDGRGTLFVGDRGNHALRSLGLDTRRVVTVAGTPSRCGNDDGPLETATFCDPSAVTYGDGQVFVADASTSTIRRVDLQRRLVTTLAGAPFMRGHIDGPGQTARFASPSSIVYRDGVLFVADPENQVIRRVDARTGDVSTIAGALGEAGTTDGARAQARFTRPRAVALSGADALLVIDHGSVRRVTLQDGMVSRLFDAGRGLRLGSAAPELSQPVSAAEIGPGDVLIVDRSESSILRALY